MTNQINELKLDKKPEDMSDEEKLAYLRKIMTDEEYSEFYAEYLHMKELRRKTTEAISHLIRVSNGGNND